MTRYWFLCKEQSGLIGRFSVMADTWQEALEKAKDQAAALDPEAQLLHDDGTFEPIIF